MLFGRVPGARLKGMVFKMIAWWNDLSIVQQVFYLIATPSTVILLIQTILLLFGFGHDSEADVDHDVDAGDMDHDGSGADHVEGLRLLSVRAIIAFTTVCGWAGVAMLDMGVHPLSTILISLLLGFGAMVLTAWLLHRFVRMQESGNLDTRNAVGQTGEVYVPIPADGRGKVTLVVQDRFMEMDAVCPAGALKTGQHVRVTDVTETGVLIVTPEGVSNT